MYVCVCVCVLPYYLTIIHDVKREERMERFMVIVVVERCAQIVSMGRQNANKIVMNF